MGHVGVGLVELFDATTLAPLPAPPAPEREAGDLPNVAWSADGRTLYAAGTQHLASGVARIAVWEEGRAGSLEAERGTILALRGLPGGDLVVASGDPWIGRLGAGGERRWQHLPVQMDARDQHATLAVSDDGTVVEFGYLSGGRETARFDVATLKLLAGPAEGGLVAPPDQTSLGITGWNQGTEPRLLGRPLGTDEFEVSRSLAIAPTGARFILGTEWNLRAFDREGVELWRRPGPGAAWAVNVSGDGRLGGGGVRRRDHPLVPHGRRERASRALSPGGPDQLGAVDPRRHLCGDERRAHRAALARQPRLGRGRRRRCPYRRSCTPCGPRC